MTQRIFSASHLGQLRYDLIWVQRVLLYLTDADLLAVLERLRGALRPNGVLIIKENCLLKSNTSGCLEQIQGWRSKAQGRLVQVNKMTLCASDAMAVFPISFTYRHTHTSFLICLLQFTQILLSKVIIEGSLEVKLPKIWTDGKAEVGRVREEKRRRKKIREEKESEERRCRCGKK